MYSPSPDGDSTGETTNDVRFPAISADAVEHVRGDNARSNNIAAARAVGEAVRSTLGPTGLDKMLVSSGTITVTNDGETVLTEMDIEHPAAKALVEVARAQVQEVGDGTTTSVLLASELLRTAEDLLDRDVHPTVVVAGYQHAVDRAVAELTDLARPVDPDDALLRRLSESSMTGKAVSPHAETLTSLVLDATQAVTVDGTVDVDYLKTVSRAGASAGESRLRHGAVLDADPCRGVMPTEHRSADVLLVHQDIDVTEPESLARADLDDVESRDVLASRSDQWGTAVVDHVAELGATVVLCHGRVDDSVAQRLASRGILAVQHISRTETEFPFLREVTGATPVMDPLEATGDHLGTVDVSGDGPISVENPDTHGVTLVLRGTTEPIAEEIERSVTDSIDIVSRTVEDGRILPGGGATEIELARRLRDSATGIDDRTQLVVDAFADALEVVPRTLASNAGLDPLDVLVDLRTAHASDHPDAGIDATTGETRDMFDGGVVQPAYVTEQTVYTAARAASIVLKVDEVISAAHLSQTDDEAENGTR